jgi:hypothetical protein
MVRRNSATTTKSLRPHVYLLRLPEDEWQRFAARCRQNGWAYSWVIKRLIQNFTEQVTDVSPVPRTGGQGGKR